jgi:signal transduction histidine kinase
MQPRPSLRSKPADERPPLETQAAERVRLARDLHDGVLQTLTGAALRLEAARQLLATEPQAASRLIEEVQELLVFEQRELRDFIGDLETERASGPEAAGLDERLARLAERIARLWDLKVELSFRLGGREIPARLAHDIYRLVQEALVNAARHGRASRATVDLHGDGPSIRVSVADNGHGFPFLGEYDFATLTDAKLGPVSLKRRVTALGGSLDIASSAAGARIEVSLPQEPEG